jgi:hypothetical protein
MSILSSLQLVFELLVSAASKAAREIEKLKEDLISHPTIDGTASDAAAEEIERHAATTTKVRVPTGEP